MSLQPPSDSLDNRETRAQSAEASSDVFRRHSRRFEDNRFVYPVVSRRSQGVSIGINLNPDRVCNFDCIYCQVDRRSESETRFVSSDQLLDELRHVLELVVSDDIYQLPGFDGTPQAFRRLNDLAFSGDGEPTTFVNFDEIVGQVAHIRSQLAPADTKMVLITNASMFHREHVQRGLQTLDHNNGQIWAKLDAGTDDYYHLVDRTSIPFQRILDNITSAAQVRPVVIQSLFMNVNLEPPAESEIAAYCQRLNEIRDAGGVIDFVQIYTVARTPAESFVSALTIEQLEGIADAVRSECSLTALTFA